jgi:hypothetical protein
VNGGDVDAAIARLVGATLSDPADALYPSVYETARLVSLAPWLRGHAARLAYLLAEQRADGSWGGPERYALVPTLSATEALVRTLACERDGGADRARVESAAGRGLRAAQRLLAEAASGGVAPTVVAIFTVPALVQAINGLVERAPGFADRWPSGGRLERPASLPDGPLAALREGGFRVSRLVGHYLELVGPVATQDPGFDPGGDFLGCSPAATAAWLGESPPAGHPAIQVLDDLQARHRGLVPTLTSIVFYERAWLLGNLIDAGVEPGAVRALADDLPPRVGELGAPTAPGLAYEAETTSVVAAALARIAVVQAPTFLWQYDAKTHFMATIPEHAPSATTNAHVMEAMGAYLASAAVDAARYADAIRRIAAWLRERQHADGYWTDKWHAAPLFATMRCALALHRHGGDLLRDVVDRAVRWILRSQRDDGAWGQWDATAEETAYAVQTLLHVSTTVAGDVERAVARGCSFLRRRGIDGPHPPLWIGKELYTPVRIVQAAILGALKLGAARSPAFRESQDVREGRPCPHSS